MQLPRDELDQRLAALDEAIVMMRAWYPVRDDLLAAVASASDAILRQAGDDRDYVSGRLLAIMITHGLAIGGPTPGPVLDCD